MSSNPLSNEQSNRLKKIASIASVALASSLSLIKLFAALYTGSLAVLSSLVDSIADVFSSMITFVAIRFSSLPASHQHRYGFGKVEALSALIQSAFVAGSGVFVIYEGVRRFIAPKEVVDTGWGLIVMIFSLCATIGLIVFQKYVVKKTKSLAVSADSVHYMVDVATNLSIIFSLLVVKFFKLYWFDTLAAIFISAYLLINAYKIAKTAINLLLDRELDDQIRKEAEKTILDNCFTKGIHDLRTRDLGGIYMFEFHLELDGNLSLYEAHELTDIVEEKLMHKFPNSQIIIHQDPAGLKEDRLDNRLVK